MNRKEKLVKNTFVLALGTFVPKFAGLITLPLLTAYLTKEEYGSYDLVLTLVSLILPAVTLQIQTAAFRFLIDKRDDKKSSTEIITNIYAFSIPISLLCLSIVFCVLPIEGALTKLIICLYFFADLMIANTRQIARGLSKNLDYSISAIISSFGNVILAIIFVMTFRQGLDGAILALVLANSIAVIVLFFKTDIHHYIDIHSINKQTLFEMIKYSWPMVPNSLGLWVMRLSDRLVITASLGVSANAIYAVANKIPQLLTTAQSTFTMAWQESASIASRDSDAGKYYSEVFDVIYNFYVGCMALLIGFTPVLFKILIKGSYEEAYSQMPILFFGVFFNCLTAYLGGIYVAMKKTTSVGTTTALAAICNFIIDIFFVKKIGIWAGSISTLVSYALLFVFRIIDIQKIIRLDIKYSKSMILLGVLSIMSFMCLSKITVLLYVNFVLGTVLMCVLNRSILLGVMHKISKNKNGM